MGEVEFRLRIEIVLAKCGGTMKSFRMHIFLHGWVAFSFALPVAALSAALEKQHRFISVLCESFAWVLLNLW